MAEHLAKLKVKRGQHKSSLTRCNNFFEKIDLNNINKVTCNEIKTRLDRLVGELDLFNQVQAEIEIILGVTEEEDTERENFETSYYSLVARMEEILQKFSDSDNQSIISCASSRQSMSVKNADNRDEIVRSNNVNEQGNDNQSNKSANQTMSANNLNYNEETQILNNVCNNMPSNTLNNQLFYPQVQLPLMKLPTFDGDYNKWVEFRYSFDALIEKNPIISNVQKMHHLRSCLEKDVLETIKAIPVSDQNYQLSWRILRERYEKSQLIVNNHVRLILDFPRLFKESAKELRNLYNNINNNLEALRNLNEPVGEWNAILIPIITDKLDTVSKREWEKYCTLKDARTVNDLFKMLKNRCEILEKLEASKTSLSNIKIDKFNYKTDSKKPNYSTAHVNTVSKFSCFLCNGNHSIYKCENILKLTPVQRYEEIKKLNLCVNCLKPSHNVSGCSSSKCRQCGKPHNTLLHRDAPNVQSTKSSNNNFQNPTVTNSGTGNVSKGTILQTSSTHTIDTVANVSTLGQILLSTAMISIKDADGNFHQYRALLDSGAMSNFVSQKVCNELNLNLRKAEYAVSGVGEMMQNVKFIADFNIHSNYNKFNASVSCLVMDRISSNIPLTSFSRRNLKLPKFVQLADPTFNASNPVDILLGSSIFWQLLGKNQINIPKTELILHETKFGWILAGKVKDFGYQNQRKHYSIDLLSCDVNLEKQLTKFWQVEDIQVKSNLSKSEQFCEQHFTDTIKRDKENRFVVNIPFKDNVTDLGQSRELALKRFYAQESRLLKNPQLFNGYSKFLLEYESLGHMEKIEETVDNEELNYYIPHHAVVRESSSTTKLRVVFNASMKSNNGLSLNDVQHIGPTIQNKGVFTHIQSVPQTSDYTKLHADYT